MSTKRALAINQIPLWKESARGIPMPFVRSAVFSVGMRSARKFLRGEVIASFPGTKISYTGEELRTDDEDVLMQVLHLTRGCQVDPEHGVEIVFSGFSLLKELGWGTSKPAYDRLRGSLTRLQNGSIELNAKYGDNKSLLFSGQILRKFLMTTEDDTRQNWSVWLEPEVVKLFNPVYLEIDWSERMKLCKPISKWLHGFMAGADSDKVFCVPDTEIRRLSGSTTKSIGKFRQLLKEALEEMQKECVIVDWRIHDGMVYIAKQPGLDINRATRAFEIEYSNLGHNEATEEAGTSQAKIE